MLLIEFLDFGLGDLAEIGVRLQSPDLEGYDLIFET